MAVFFPRIECTDRKYTFQSPGFGSARPADVERMINLVAQRVATASIFESHHNSAFSVRRKKEDYHYGKSSLHSILDRLLLKNTKKIQVLDLGCGNAEVLLRMTMLFFDRVMIKGVDMVKSPLLPDERYIYGNIEYLLEIDALKTEQFDLICSSGVFNRLVDPLAALSFAYEKLKPGGMLIVDDVTLPGFSGHERELLSCLRAYKYRVSGGIYEKRGFAYLIFNKTQPHLYWPVFYGPCSFSGATYVLRENEEPSKDCAPQEQKKTVTQA